MTIDPELLRRQKAFFWTNLRGAKWTGGPLGQRTLDDLLGPLVALKKHGTFAELKTKYDTVRKAAIVNRDLPEMNDEDRERFRGMFNELNGYIRFLCVRMKEAEEFLRNAGWKFVPGPEAGTGKLSRIAGHKGRDLLTECVWVIYTAKYRREYRKATDARKQSIRRKIAAELAPYFDADLSAGSEAPIYRIIDKGDRRSQR